MSTENPNKVKNFLLKRKGLLIVLLVVILGAGGFWYYKSTRTSQVTYTTSKAARGNIVETIGTTGTVEPIQDVFLTFKSGGYVESCYVKLGDTVSTGQILAAERSSDLEAALQQANASLASAEANYEQISATYEPQLAQAEASVLTATVNLETATRNLERNQQLFKSGALSQSELDTFQQNYDLAVIQLKSAQASLEIIQAQNPASLASAEAQMSSASASVQTAQNNLEDSVMVAPFNGYVAIINGNVGQWTGGGAPPVGTAATSQFSIEISSVDLQMTAEINEADIAAVQIGQTVDFTVDAYPLETFTGRLIAVAPKAVESNSLQVYNCTISIDDWKLLKSGMPASINVHVNSADNVILVPYSAVTYAKSYFSSNNVAMDQTSSSSGEDSEYLVVLNNGQPEVRQVVMGLTDNINIEVKSGLQEGDQVIIGDSAGSTSSSSSSSSSKSQQGSSRSGGPPMF